MATEKTIDCYVCHGPNNTDEPICSYCKDEEWVACRDCGVWYNGYDDDQICLDCNNVEIFRSSVKSLKQFPNKRLEELKQVEKDLIELIRELK